MARYVVRRATTKLEGPQAKWDSLPWAAIDPLELERWEDVRACEWRPQMVEVKVLADSDCLGVIF